MHLFFPEFPKPYPNLGDNIISDETAYLRDIRHKPDYWSLNLNTPIY